MATTKKTTTSKAKKSNKLWAWITAGLLGAGALGTGAYFIFGKKGKPNNVDDTALPSKTSTGKNTSTLSEGSYPLNFGAKSKLVMKIQMRLLSLGGSIAQVITSSGGADAMIGPGTKSAIIKAGYSLPFTKEMGAKLGNKTGIENVANSNKYIEWAMRLHKAIDGYFTDIPEIKQIFEEFKNSYDFTKTSAEYLKKYNVKLSKDLNNEVLFKINPFFTKLLDEKNITHDLNGLGSTDKLEVIKGGLVRINQAGIHVWDKNGQTLPVSPSMILGTEISRDTNNNISSILTKDKVVIFAPTTALKKA